jgi:hypothetical protein
MLSLRSSAAAAPQADLLSWAKAGDEKADVLSDWSFQFGTLALYKLHSAVVCSGPRRSEKARAQAIRALTPSETNQGSRVTDVAALLPDAARAALLKDPHTQATIELLLAATPNGSSAKTAAPAAGAIDITEGGASGGVAPDLTRSATSAMDFFSTAIFGTPSKGGGGGGAAPSTPAGSLSRGASKELGKPGGGSGRTAPVKPEQIPLLWQLADALGVCGLKAALLPLFEQSALPSTFVMEAPAFERLKLLVRALELHTEEIVAALCEQLRLPPPPTAAVKDPLPLREGMAALAVAASAVDPSRYEPLVACGLLPASDPTRLASLLDKSSLRVASEAQVHDLLLKHFSAQNTPPATQAALWATCRFSYLPSDQLVELSEIPNVPPKWLALACAQRAASTAGTDGPSTSGTKPEESQRLKPRAYYCV